MGGGELEGRRVLITGAAGGLGRAVAKSVTEAGASVALCDLPSDGLEETLVSLGAGSAPAVTIGADISDQDACKAAVAATVQQLGGIDGLVACAGIMQTKPLLDLTADEWRRVIDVNLNGAFFCLQAAAKAMAASGGAIVLFSSVAGRSGRAMAAHYAASKTAILSLTKSAALALGPSVRVNAVCPGVFLTPMWDAIIAERTALFGGDAGREYLQDVCAHAPLARTGEPPELAAVVKFLLSDASSYVTGQALNVDGGLEMD
jgi:NAD(P)-dependent dehydrogenase (short-subunit alcohol dehydrogenase family)